MTSDSSLSTVFHLIEKSGDQLLLLRLGQVQVPHEVDQLAKELEHNRRERVLELSRSLLEEIFKD